VVAVSLKKKKKGQEGGGEGESGRGGGGGEGQLFEERRETVVGTYGRFVDAPGRSAATWTRS